MYLPTSIGATFLSLISDNSIIESFNYLYIVSFISSFIGTYLGISLFFKSIKKEQFQILCHLSFNNFYYNFIYYLKLGKNIIKKAPLFITYIESEVRFYLWLVVQTILLLLLTTLLNLIFMMQ